MVDISSDAELEEELSEVVAEPQRRMATEERYMANSAGSHSPIMSDSGDTGSKARGGGLKGNVVSSIFILLTTCIGAGTLSLPYAFSQGGIFVFSIIFFLIMVRLVTRDAFSSECVHVSLVPRHLYFSEMTGELTEGQNES